MTWLEIEQLTQQVLQLPAVHQRTSQQLSQVMVSAHSTMIEGSRVTVLEAFDFLLGEAPTLGPGKPLEGYDMLNDHARALDLALAQADAQQLPSLSFLRELAAAVMRSTGRVTNTALGTVDPTQGDLRRNNVFIVGASSFPNSQKVPALVAALVGELRQRMPGATTLREQLELAFEAHQRLVSIHPFNDGNGRTSRLLMNYVQRYYGQPLTIVFREDRQAYFEALEQSRVTEDLTVFGEFMLEQHAKSLAYQLSAAAPPTYSKYPLKHTANIMEKHPRPITIPGPGDGFQPVRFLQPFLLGAFENASPNFVEILEEQVRYNGANPEVTYDMDPNPVIGPRIEGLEGSIYMQETFLSYLWGITYSALVIYDEMLVRPRITPDYARTAGQQTLINDAVALLGYALSLKTRYTHWPLNELPNPELYNEQEAHYVEKADAVFVQATAFILVHEYAHRYLGHLEDDEFRSATNTIQPADERKADEYAADRFAIEMMMEGAASADETTSYTMLCGVIIGLGAILMLHPTLDGGEEHPDPHKRLQAGLSILGQTPSDNLWGISAMMISQWAMATGKPPVGGYTYDSLQDLFAVSMSQLNDPRYY